MAGRNCHSLPLAVVAKNIHVCNMVLRNPTTNAMAGWDHTWQERQYLPSNPLLETHTYKKKHCFSFPAQVRKCLWGCTSILILLHKNYNYPTLSKLCKIKQSLPNSIWEFPSAILKIQKNPVWHSHTLQISASVEKTFHDKVQNLGHSFGHVFLLLFILIQETVPQNAS